MKRISKNEKLQRGTYRKDKDLVLPYQLSKHSIFKEIPAIPEGLTKAEAVLFYDYCCIKLKNETLNSADIPEIETLCKLLSKRDDLFSELQTSGFIIEFKTGHKQVSPALTVCEKVDRLINAKLRLLGLDSLTLKKIDKLNARIEYSEAQDTTNVNYLIDQLNNIN